MFTHPPLARIAALLLSTCLVGASSFIVIHHLREPKTITAYFTSATGIYPGDEVRVSGVKVGSIESIDAAGTQVRMVMTLARDVPLPADSRAVVVAQNLVSSRYVQLAAPSNSTAAVIADDAVISEDRTAVPVEWDEVKTQLTRLAGALGPTGANNDSSLGRFINSAADAMGGNGAKLRETLTQISQVGRTLAAGSGDIATTIANLQTLVSALRLSNDQIVQFQERFATLTNVLDGSKSDLDAALENLSQAVGEVQAFVAATRDKTSTQIQRLASVTQTLVDHRGDLEQVLHVAPSAIANTYNMMDPQIGSATGVFTFINFSNPVQFICSMIGAVENVTAVESGKLCAQYLGPALRLLNFNTLPLPINPVLAKTPGPEDLIYTEPQLMPGATAAPVATPTDLPSMLLPAEAPPTQEPPSQQPPAPDSDTAPATPPTVTSGAPTP